MLPKTKNILDEIDLALAELQKNLAGKKENVKTLKQTAEQSIKKIDTLIASLDKVSK